MVRCVPRGYTCMSIGVTSAPVALATIDAYSRTWRR